MPIKPIKSYENQPGIFEVSASTYAVGGAPAILIDRVLDHIVAFFEVSMLGGPGTDDQVQRLAPFPQYGITPDLVEAGASWENWTEEDNQALLKTLYEECLILLNAINVAREYRESSPLTQETLDMKDILVELDQKAPFLNWNGDRDKPDEL